MDDYNLDTNREERLGFPEVVYGSSKSVDLLRRILNEYQTQSRNALATRVQPEKGQALLKYFPDAHYDPVSQCFLLQANDLDDENARIGILSAGSSDLPVVNEAYYTLNLLNVPAKRINDVGVAGIHRLFDRLDDIKTCRTLIVVAGFEGALPSVVGGLLSQPIIAVPSSVGYGVATGGMAALKAMLSSCANGISVTNIDNGYGAAMAAYRILKQIDAK